jgi:5-methylcytosine-specific restriction endonuclease McrA
VDGDLDPESGQIVLTAIGSVVDAEVRSEPRDTRRAAQRRADALREICRAYLDRSDRPVVAGERPHVLVRVDWTTLAGATGTARVGDTGSITAEDARRVACDASVSRIVIRGRSEPLDVGRRSPVVSPTLRRAVVARDGDCRFPGCDRPDRWSDAHHVVHWADGGPTSLSNLILLCRRHHRLVHERFDVEMFDGRPVFTRPDGSVLEERAPP